MLTLEKNTINTFWSTATQSNIFLLWKCSDYKEVIWQTQTTLPLFIKLLSLFGSHYLDIMLVLPLRNYDRSEWKVLSGYWLTFLSLVWRVSYLRAHIFSRSTQQKSCFHAVQREVTSSDTDYADHATGDRQRKREMWVTCLKPPLISTAHLHSTDTQFNWLLLDVFYK